MYPIQYKAPLLGVVFLGLAVVAHAASRNLVEDSPFLPPGYKTAQERAKSKPPPPKTVPQKQAELVFKGSYRLGGVWRFCIMDKKSSKSHWVVQGEEPPLGLEGLTINNFDEDGYLTYTYNGQSGELELASPSSSPASIQTGTKPKTNPRGNIPSRSPSPRPTPVRPSKPSVVSSPSKPRVPTVMVGGAQPRPATTSATPKAPPSTPAPSFIPQLPANIASQLPGGISNAMRDAEDRGQATAVKVDIAKPVGTTPATNPSTPEISVSAGTTVPAATPAATPSVFTNPGTSPGAPPPTLGTSTKIPRRASLNLPPGIPPPPTTAPPSLPEFLRVGGPPPPPPPSRKP